MKAKQQYRESTLFGVPLGANSYAIGLIARRKPRSPIIFGYFFSPVGSGIPERFDMSSLSAETAILKCRFGDLGLLRGEWPVISQLLPWERSDWPMPKFYREEPLSGRLYAVTYDDSNPARTISDQAVDALPPGAINDSLFGYKAVEITLRLILRNLH